jgi:hypothetical protein
MHGVRRPNSATGDLAPDFAATKMPAGTEPGMFVSIAITLVGASNPNSWVTLALQSAPHDEAIVTQPFHQPEL